MQGFACPSKNSNLILLNIFLRNENTISQTCIVHQSGGLKTFLVSQHSTREMWNDDLQMTWVLPDRKRLPYYTLCIPMLQQLNVGLTSFFSVPIGMRSCIPWRTIRPHDAQRYGDINTHARLKDKCWRSINRFCWVEEANPYTCKTHTSIHTGKEQCATFLVLVIVEWKALLWLPVEKKRLANSLSSALYFSTKT